MKALRQRLVLLAAFCLGAMLAAAPLIMLLRRQYAETLAAKIWPDLKVHLHNPAPDTSLANTLLILGDSRVAEWPLPKIDGWRVLNAGAPGITSGQLLLSSPALLTEARPQLVVLQVGINDLKFLGVRPDLRQAVIEQCVSNILDLAQLGRDQGAEVLVTPIWPAGKVSLARRLVWNDSIASAVMETNERLKKHFATAGGVRVVDLFAELTSGLSAAEQARLYRDTLHLKRETYASLSEALIALVSTNR